MTNELTGGSFILVIEHKYAGVGEELAAFMRDDGCVFWYVSTREWVFAGRRKSLSETCLPPLYQASEKEMGGSGCGGLSVLEESHVVGESGQLLLIWNQWDGGRICWERERESEGRKKQRRSWVRRGFLVLPSAIDLLASPRLQLGGHSPRALAQRDSAGRWFQVTSPPPASPDLFNNTTYRVSPMKHVRHSAWRSLHNTLHLNPTRMISCVRSTLWPKLPGNVKVWKGGGRKKPTREDGWWVGLACCAGHVCSRCFSSIVRWLQRICRFL